MAPSPLTHREDGSPRNPAADGWDDWVSASSTRSFALGDPLLDWLKRFGEARGFAPDTSRPDYREELDFTQFIFRQANRFEEAVRAWMDEREHVTAIAAGPEDIRSLAKAEATLNAMHVGTPIIYQGVLWDAEHAVYGAPDFLVRSDVLERLFPGTLEPWDLEMAAPDLGGPWHYRVIDAKFTTLHLAVGGHLSNGGSAPAYKVQLWLYNRALGRLQGYQPSASYLLGRSWEQRNERGPNAVERLAPVPQDGTVAHGTPIANIALSAEHWLRRLRAEGADWDVLPEPSVPGLYPNLTNAQDSPWTFAKKEIARELEELTVLWWVGREGRDEAHRQGVRRWTDPRCTPEIVGVTGKTRAPILRALLDVNREAGPPVTPARIRAAEQEWRPTPPLEFYVDFETLNDLADDFSAFPERGGQPLIFMIGCGHVENDRWRFQCFVAETATEPDEARMIDAWLEHMDAVRTRLAPDLERASVIHWSSAEVSTFTTAYNSARRRHPEADWPEPFWFDFLTRVVHPEPVVVRGAMGFGLKAVAKALHSHGLIDTLWGDGPADGLGAMLGAWACYEDVEARGEPARSLPLMQEIIAYNEVDCRVMWETVRYLRANH